MKKLITSYTGGFPFNMEDLAWLQNATIEALTQIIKPFGNNIILWGVEISGYVVSAGAVFYNNEIFLVDAFNTEGIGLSNLRSIIVEGYDAAGEKLFAERPIGDQLKNVYLIRKLTFDEGAGGEPITAFIRLNTLLSRINTSETNISKLQGYVSDLDDGIGVINNGQATQNTQITNLTRRTTTLENKVNGLTESFMIDGYIQLNFSNGVLTSKTLLTPLLFTLSTNSIILTQGNESEEVTVDYTKNATGTNTLSIVLGNDLIDCSHTEVGEGTTTIVFSSSYIGIGNTKASFYAGAVLLGEINFAIGA